IISLPSDFGGVIDWYFAAVRKGPTWLFELDYLTDSMNQANKHAGPQEAVVNVSPIPAYGIFTNSSYDDEGAVADFTNLEPVVNVIVLFPHQG
ncbi:hypothetical protein Tco_0310424, partial [Tanacetum coccineum]